METIHMWNSNLNRCLRLVVALVSAALLAQCTVNPATGKRQFNLIGEDTEIKLGRETDPEITAQYGSYPDAAMQDYVARLGTRLASASERPQLPWTFRVVDDPIVNAFALPGGFIYVTRGILAHLNSEAELVGVLGHEIGHVTARHGVNQMSWNLAAQASLGVASAVGSSGVRTASGLAQTGLGLLFLKYGRDDERQADALSVRYSLARDFDPRAMISVFATLGRIGETSGRSELPSMLSTHPRSENRQELLQAEIDSYDLSRRQLRVDGPGYLQRLDGMVFGDDPREGFFKGNLFAHPQMRFSLEFPTDWKYANTRQRVAATSPENDAQVLLTLASGTNAQEAADEFFAADGVEKGRSWNSRIGLPDLSYFFTAEGSDSTTDSDNLNGLVSFVTYDDRVFVLLALTRKNDWNKFDSTFTSSLSSFRKLTDRTLLDVQPLRLRLEQLGRDSTLGDLVGRGSPVPIEQLAIINNVEADERLPRGRWVKVVEGKLPPS